MATIIVNTTVDEADGSIVDGDISLRDAVAAANAAAGADTIQFDAAIFNGQAADILRLTQGQIVITGALTIDGGTAGVTITGDKNGDDVVLAGGITDVRGSGAARLDDNSRIFDITNATAATTLDGLTLTGGRTFNADGGAVRSLAALTLTDSTVSGNIVAADEGTVRGGGVWAGGPVTLTNSTVSGNEISSGYGYARGGGVYAAGAITLTKSIVSDNNIQTSNGSLGGGIFASGTVTLTDSTVRDNGAVAEFAAGGGIQAGSVLLTRSTLSGNGVVAFQGGAFGGGVSANDVTLTDSTVSGNTAFYYSGGHGGGISAGTATLMNSTVSGNVAGGFYGEPGFGGGMEVGSATLTNSIVLGNFDNFGGLPSEIRGTFTQNGPNIVGGVDPADVFADIDPANGGGLLADNGGPTQTIAILPRGLAAGGADPATATATDQRGVPRDADPDLGAFEAEQIGPPDPFRIEAESLARHSGFRVENVAAASAGKVIKSPNTSVDARASFTFTEEDGVYDIDLGYFDENDGRSRLSVFVNDVRIDSFTFNKNLGSGNATAATHAVRHIAEVELEEGDVVRLVGRSNGDEPLRVDYLDFTFVDDLVS